MRYTIERAKPYPLHHRAPVPDLGALSVMATELLEKPRNVSPLPVYAPAQQIEELETKYQNDSHRWVFCPQPDFRSNTLSVYLLPKTITIVDASATIEGYRMHYGGVIYFEPPYPEEPLQDPLDETYRNAWDRIATVQYDYEAMNGTIVFE